MTTNKSVDLHQETRDYVCGDGCCSDWWEELYVNGKEVYAGGDINGDAIIAVLNALGYDVHSGGKTYKAGDSNV